MAYMATYDVAKKIKVSSIKCEGDFLKGMFYTTKKRYIWASSDGLYLSNGRDSKKTWSSPSEVIDVSFGKQIMALCTDKSLYIFRMADMKLIGQFEVKGAKKVSISRDGSQLAYSFSDEDILRVLNTREMSNAANIYESNIADFALSNDGTYIVYRPESSSKVVLKQTPLGSEVLSYYHKNDIQAIGFSAGGKYFFSADNKNHIRYRKLDNLPYDVKRTRNNHIDFDVANDHKTVALSDANSLYAFNRESISAQLFEESTSYMDALGEIPFNGLKQICVGIGSDRYFVLGIKDAKDELPVVAIPLGFRDSKLFGLLKEWTYIEKFTYQGYNH